MPYLGEVMSDDNPRRPRMTPPGGFPPEPPETNVRMRSETEKALREYLAFWQQDQNEGNTIKNLRSELHDTRLEMGQMQIDLKEVATEQRLVRLRLDRHGRDIRELKRIVYHRGEAGDEVDTDVHQVEDLRRHLAEKEQEIRERRDSVTWWKRKRVDVIIAIGGAIAMLGITALGGVVWYVITHPSPAPSHQEK